MSAPSLDRAELRSLDRALLARVHGLIQHLGLTGKYRGTTAWRGGPEGARITVNLSGSHAGAWGAWAEGNKGAGLIGLIAHIRGFDFGRAIEEAKSFLGLQPGEMPAPAAQEERPAADGNAKGIERARRVWRRSRGLHGTLAERYLVNTRGIPRLAAGWPSALAYDPGDPWHPHPTPALVAVITDAGGAVVAVHRVFLGPEARKISEAECEARGLIAVKRTDGPKSRGKLQFGDTGRLFIAEGVETALAVHAATGERVLVTLGPIADLVRLPEAPAFICIEDHLPSQPIARLMGKAMSRWSDAGASFSLVWPWAERRGDKSDLADTMLAQGADAVRARIAAAELAARLPRQVHQAEAAPSARPQRVAGEIEAPEDDAPPYDAIAARAAELALQRLQLTDPPFPLPTATPADVQSATFQAIHTFFFQRSLTPPVRMVVPAMTGSGKTRAGEALLPHIILADKSERELEGRENTPWRVVIMVPAHRLGRQIKQRYEKAFAPHGLTVATLEGRGDPWNEKPTRDYLCDHPKAVGLAIKAKADVRSAVCVSGKRSCTSYCGCRYFGQLEAAKKADVLIVSHEFMFENLPDSVVHDVATVIIEEEFVSTGDAISDLPLDPLRKNAIDIAPAYTKGTFDPAKTEDLHRYNEKVLAMLDGEPDGYLAAAAPSRYGLVPSDFRYLRFLNWKRERDAKMHPAMTLAEREAALRDVPINQHLPKIAAMMHMLANGQTGRLRLTTDSKGLRTVVLHGQREIAAWIADKPILFLNATARLPDVQRFFGSAILIEQPQARLEHQRVRQILGSFGKSAMTGKKIADLLARTRRHLAQGKTVLVICHQQVEHVFKALPAAQPVEEGLPQLRVLHHGDYAGDDDHGDVDVVMQIGAPFATARQIAELATARSGVPVPTANPVRMPCAALMEDGTGIQFERLKYEHKEAQHVHEGIYDTSIIQGALGRGRGINRTAKTPLEIEIYGNVPVPVPLAELTRWRPNREHDLLSNGGSFSNARDLYRFHLEEFDSEDAAGKWRNRNPWDEALLRDLLATDRRPHSKVTWQPKGQGHKLRFCVVPTADVAALRRRVEREFPAGIQVWEVAAFTAGEEADKPTNTLKPGSDSSPVGVPPQAKQCPVGTVVQPEERVHPPDG